MLYVTADSTKVHVDTAGHVVIPAELRHKLGIKEGDELTFSETPGGIRLQTLDQAARAAQNAFSPYRIPGHSVVDEVIRERRDEARREYGE
jgi:AbrB family looped-hinge helix DNA binding protein